MHPNKVKKNEKKNKHSLSDTVCSSFSNVLKIRPDRPIRPVQPSTGHRSGLIRSFGPDWDRRGWTARTDGSTGKPDEPIDSNDFNFFFLNYKMKILPSHCKHGKKDSIKFKWFLLKHMLGLSYDTVHIPTPITVGWVLSPQNLGVIWLFVPLIFRCGIAKYQRKKT